MRITALTTVADDSRTLLSRGLAIARTLDRSVISALPLTFYRKAVSLPTPDPCRAWNALKRQRLVFWFVALALAGLLAVPWLAPLFY